MAANHYRPLMAHLVPAFKDDGALQLRSPLGRRLAGAVRELGLDGEVVLVPVPSLAHSRRRRGLDHGLALARTAARLTGYRAQPLVTRVPIRDGRQRGRGRQERRALLSDEMYLTRRPRPGVGVVVTDDVVTTGSSLAATVAALRRAGLPVLGAAVIADADRRLERGVDVAPGHPAGE